MATIVALHVNPYDFADKETGRQITGINLHYIDIDSPAWDGAKGFPVGKVQLPPRLRHVFEDVPGVYRVKWSVSPSPSGKAIVKLEEAEYLWLIDIESIARGGYGDGA